MAAETETATVARASVERELEAAEAPGSAIAAVFLVLAASLLLARVGARRPQRGLWVYGPVLQLGLWALGAWAVLSALVAAARSEGQLGWSLALAVLLGLAAVAGRRWLESALASAVLVLARRVVIGDAIEVAGIQGVVQGFGLSAVVLRRADGTEVAISSSDVLRGPIHKRTLEGGDAPCVITLPMPAGLEAAAVMEAARRAAVLSAFASARRRPEIRLTAPSDPGAGGLLLEVRGYVFDDRHRDDFRSDFLARLEEGLSQAREAARAGVGGAPRAAPIPGGQGAMPTSSHG